MEPMLIHVVLVYTCTVWKNRWKRRTIHSTIFQVLDIWPPNVTHWP